MGSALYQCSKFFYSHTFDPDTRIIPAVVQDCGAVCRVLLTDAGLVAPLAPADMRLYLVKFDTETQGRLVLLCPQDCGAVYGVLLTEVGLVALAGHSASPPLHPADLLLLATFLRANDSLRQVGMIPKLRQSTLETGDEICCTENI